MVDRAGSRLARQEDDCSRRTELVDSFLLPALTFITSQRRWWKDRPGISQDDHLHLGAALVYNVYRCIKSSSPQTNLSEYNDLATPVSRRCPKVLRLPPIVSPMSLDPRDRHS